jgi:hypothetical protein
VHGKRSPIVFQLKPSSSIMISRARFTSAAGALRKRASDSNAWRSSVVRLRVDMPHIVLRI